MKIYNKLFVLGLILSAFFGISSSVLAMTPTLSLSLINTNNVTLTVYGDANSSVNLYYSSNYGLQNVYLGTTNNVGYFYTTLSTTNYNIVQGNSVYVIVNNQQSNSAIWPNTYYQNNNNNIVANNNFTISSLSIPVFGSATISMANGASGVYVSSNSNPNVANAILSSNTINTGCGQYDQYNPLTGQPCYYGSNYYTNTNYNTNNGSVTITGLATGTSVITICQNNHYNNYSNTINNCNTINITVNGNNIIGSGSVLGASTSGTCYISRTLKYGMSGADVSCLQSYLMNKGYLYNTSTSSYFDVNTRNAVVLLQRANGLFPDGIVGRNTRNYLY